MPEWTGMTSRLESLVDSSYDDHREYVLLGNRKGNVYGWRRTPERESLVALADAGLGPVSID